MKVMVKGECLYPHPVDPTQVIKVGSAEWFKWLAEPDRFVYRGESGAGGTVRREARCGAIWGLAIGWLQVKRM